MDNWNNRWEVIRVIQKVPQQNSQSKRLTGTQENKAKHMKSNEKHILVFHTHKVSLLKSISSFRPRYILVASKLKIPKVFLPKGV